MCKHKLNKRSKLKQRLRQKFFFFKAYLKAKAPRLDFLLFPSVKSIQFNEIVISNLQLKRIGTKKGRNQIKRDLRVFREKLLFDSLFFIESQVFFVGSLCILKMYYVRLFIVEKIRFGTAPRRCGIHSKPQPLLQKTCISYASETLAMYIGMCLRTHALAHVCRPQPTHVD